MSSFLALRFLVLHEKDEWLWKKHNRHRQYGELHEHSSRFNRTWPQRSGISVTDTKTHRHCNEGVNDHWWVVHGSNPLVEDHNIHPTEEAQQKDHHRNAFAEEICHVLLVECIAPLQAHSYEHLQDTEEDR